MGLVAKMQKDNRVLEIGGTLQQKISNCLEVLNDFLCQKTETIVSSMVVAEKKRNFGSESVVDAVANILGKNAYNNNNCKKCFELLLQESAI